MRLPEPPARVRSVQNPRGGHGRPERSYRPRRARARLLVLRALGAGLRARAGRAFARAFAFFAATFRAGLRVGRFAFFFAVAFFAAARGRARAAVFAGFFAAFGAAFARAG